MRAEDITIQIPKDERVFIFKSDIMLKGKEMDELRNIIVKQIETGTVLIPAYVDLVYPFPTLEPTDD